MAPATLTLVFMLLLSAANAATVTDLINSILPLAEKQYKIVASQQTPLFNQSENPSAYPFDGKPTEDKWWSTKREVWTSGFLSGIFWHLASLAADNKSAAEWQQRAETAQQGLVPMQDYNQTHDIGFIMFSSFGNAFLRTGKSSYFPPLHATAFTLSNRYNRKVGCTRSWENKKGAPPERFEVIIDNMMNLELLFWVANYTASSRLYNIAVSHATRTISEHIRPDGSTWQVVAYNSTDGSVIEKYTVQGYANDSTWSRGQAWAVYGFTMTYRYTKDEKFLQTAQKTADFFLEHLPSDRVPYWDFDAPFENGYKPRDTSAGAIAASALLELGGYLGEKYRNAGVEIMEELIKYRADMRAVFKIPAILLNGTSHFSTGHSDRALIFGDYYFTEGLTRLALLGDAVAPPTSL